MPGLTVGGTASLRLVIPQGNTLGIPQQPRTLTWWTAKVGGTKLTVTLDGQQVTDIPVPALGIVPEHTWPDGVTIAWGEAGDGIRQPYKAPTGGGGAGNGTVTATGITDSTSVGRTLLTSSDAAAARAAIGAGTSNLVIGTTSTTAKAGNYTPTKTDVGLGLVDNVQQEPLRSTVTQAAAEAGTETTIRGWSAQRVAQAIAGYIAANAAAIKTALGIESVPYLWSTSGAATIATTGAHPVASNQTLTQARMRVDGAAPIGSALTVVLQRSTNGGTSWTDLTTLTIAAGSTTEAVQTLTTTLTAGDLLRLNATSVGSTTPATLVGVRAYPA